MDTRNLAARLLSSLFFAVFSVSLIICAGCNSAPATSEETTAAHLHEFGEWTITKASSCSEQGSKQRTCSCGERETETLPLAEHSPIAIEAIAPSCTESGRTEGSVCSVCDTVISESQTLSATGHTHVKVEGKAPTCTEDGYTESEICSVCNTLIIESQPIKALEHTVVTIEAKAPTCTEEGHTDSEVCSTCGTVIREAQTVSALGHATVTVKGKAPTCTEDGYTESEVCSTCGTVIREAQTVSALGHATVTVKGKAATCTQDGKTDRIYCTQCNEVLVEAEVIPATGHSEQTVNGLSPTCTLDGYTSSVVCSVCNATLTPAEPLSPLGHDPVTVAATFPTCTMYGISEHLGCSRCGIPLSEFITTDPLGHTSVTVSGAEPTCTRRGYSESTKCSVCNAVLTEPVYSDPLGHKFSDNTCTVCSALADDSLNLPTKYYGLYEADTLKMICEKNADRRIEPASITKLLAAATALKYLPEDTVMKTWYELYLVNLELGRAYLEVGKEMTLYDLLIALLLPSGSDAAYTIAVHVAREVSGDPDMKYKDALNYFTELMNDYAKEIGATSSHFMNPVGEPNDQHYTTISDLALIVSHIRKTYPTINEITSSYRRTVNYLNGGSSTWTNTNYLLNPNGSFYHPNAIGMKTGTADNAGYCLCAVFDINGKEYIAIVMGCKNNDGRYGSAHKLISLVE